MDATPVHVQGQQGSVARKSGLLAFVLTFFFLGIGNVYVGQHALGAVLIVANIGLWLLAGSLVGLLLALPLWAALFALGAITSVRAARRRSAGVV